MAPLGRKLFCFALIRHIHTHTNVVEVPFLGNNKSSKRDILKCSINFKHALAPPSHLLPLPVKDVDI